MDSIVKNQIHLEAPKKQRIEVKMPLETGQPQSSSAEFKSSAVTAILLERTKLSKHRQNNKIHFLSNSFSFVFTKKYNIKWNLTYFNSCHKL